VKVCRVEDASPACGRPVSSPRDDLVVRKIQSEIEQYADTYEYSRVYFWHQ
jgi:hypothetical protein